ncbi:MAG TPA: PVC-type heme-binding CxxCH protein [Planctomycetota bacterium]|nr:PVC-type heme-binding CxxCH protein [Planctomycetota bacterium]
MNAARLALALLAAQQEPEKAVETFRVLHGFRMELLAAEPLVMDPVDVAYDEDGRAYVVEMRDYPFPLVPGGPPSAVPGRVRLLVDADGDGRFDRASVFADGLERPTAVACWKGGVFVLAAPDLIYFKDTDGDGRADVRRVALSGFGTKNVQALANNLRWGLDHRLYGAGSGNGGDLRSTAHPGAPPLPLRRRDVVFDPESGRVESDFGAARFGNAFDDWGNRFVCNIRNPLQHVVLPARYMDRSRLGAGAPAVHDAAPTGDRMPVFGLAPPEAWRRERADRWAAEGQAVPRSELVAGGVFTSASAATVYRGSAYPEAFRGQVFLGEVAGQLVHRMTLVPEGVTFAARRADPEAEFVASTDSWFRPVNFVNAPDGTLHVVDMYRQTIEHPWSIPDDIRDRLDLARGNDRGRLWRLAPPRFRPPAPPRLGKAGTAELVACLERPDAWWRETAHRLLHERQDPAAVGPLRTLLRQGGQAVARLHALWSLEGLRALSDDDLAAALADGSPRVREHAVRLAERRPGLAASIVARASDPDPRVRLQAAFSLGETGGPGRVEGLAALALRDAADPWIRAAVLSSAEAVAGALLERLAPEAAGDPALLGALAQAAPSQARAALPTAPTPDARFALLGGLLAARQGDAGLARPLLDEARRTAADPDAPLARRVQAIGLLRHDDVDRARDVLAPLLEARQPDAVQRAAVRALGGSGAERAGAALIDAWRSCSPAVRGDVLDLLLGRGAWALALLEAVEKDRIPAAQVPSDRRARLLNHPEATIKARAEKLFGAGATAARGEVVARYRPALAAPGDPAKGRAHFRRACASCHRHGGEGAVVGPDLAVVRHHAPEQLLPNILDPNREVSPDYAGYWVRTKDGRDLTGLIVAENAASLTLRVPGGEEAVVSRGDVASMRALGLSLMPEGLERGLEPADLADLIAFIRTPEGAK